MKMQVSHLPHTNTVVLLLGKKKKKKRKAVGKKVRLLLCLIHLPPRGSFLLPSGGTGNSNGIRLSSSLLQPCCQWRPGESPNASFLVQTEGREGGFSLQTYCALRNSCTNMLEIKSLDWWVWKIA